VVKNRSIPGLEKEFHHAVCRLSVLNRIRLLSWWHALCSWRWVLRTWIWWS